MTEFLQVAETIAREAGALLREFYHRGVRTEYKGDVDLVTEADRASEKLIVSRLHEAFPDHGVYGEEGTRSGLEREFRWYVDPLDGTTNFAHGFPAFCVVLGCERRAPGLAADEDGEMVAGVVYDPLRDEMFSAARGHGATLNGEAIHVSRAKLLQESLIATGFPSQKRHESPNVNSW
jgi:myo-inositol-1(or 4)-monophosphatase